MILQPMPMALSMTLIYGRTVGCHRGHIMSHRHIITIHFKDCTIGSFVERRHCFFFWFIPTYREYIPRYFLGFIHYTDAVLLICFKSKMEDIWLGPTTKAPTPTEKSKAQCDNTRTPPKTSITTIADRHRTVSWGNESHPTGVVKPVYGFQTFPLTTTAVLSKGHTFKIL